MRIRSMLAGLSVCFIVAGMTVPAAQAAPNAAEPEKKSVTAGTVRTLTKVRVAGTVTERDLDDATQRDLAVWAKSKGVPMERAAEKFRGQNEINALADRLAADPATGFVQAGYVKEGAAADGADVWLRFTGEPSKEVLAQIKKLPYTVEVQTGAPLPWKDLLQVQESMYRVVMGADGVAGAVSEVDPVTDEIRLTYSVAPDKKIDQEALLRNAMDAGSATGKSAGASVPVRLTEVDEIRSQDQATIKGGHWLTDSTGNCTSGFTVTVNGVNGIATAMHCPNYMGYEGAAGVISYRNAASTTSTGANIDLQWHSTIAGNSTSTKFQANYSEERNVDSASNAVNGAPVCNFGKGKDYQLCGTIYRLSVCRQGSLYWCGQAVTQENITVAGDSGGPWYLGNVAKGYHSGLVQLDGDGVNRSAYTPQTRVGENLGGNVRTS